MSLSYFIDVQGTLIDDTDKKPIKGSIEFIRYLNEKKIPYVVVTNNTKVLSEEFHSFLLSLGFEIPKENYLDPFMVLDKTLTCKEIVAFGADEFVDTLGNLGYDLTSRNPKAMLISSKKDFDSKDYASMIESALKGVKIIGMHATSIYAKDGRRYPGVGAILQMISYATSKEYEIIGKPSQSFYNEALRLLNLQSDKRVGFEDVTMISDDAIGDLKGIKESGSKTVLVLSGKCKSEKEIEPIKDKIDEIHQDIGKML